MSSSRMPARDSIPFNLYKISRPGVATVISNIRLNPQSSEEVCHLELDLREMNYPYLEGQSMGVLPPGLDERGKPHKLRLYSIASTRVGDDRSSRTLSLCVKRDITRIPETGEVHYGVASNYLCDLQPGAKINATGPVGKAFLLPEDPSCNLIMIATGTGIAPFRAFLKRIYEERSDWTGKAMLFFGVRTRSDYLYGEEFEALQRQTGFSLVTAFSREQTNAQGGRMYVQHRMAEHVEELWGLIQQDNTYIYICGLKGMEDGIDAVIADRAAADGVVWTEYRDDLVHKHGRLLIETY